MQQPFKFNLGQQARITVSSEAGQIIGRAECTATENSYYLRYKSAEGRAVQAWWDESALTAPPVADQACDANPSATTQATPPAPVSLTLPPLQPGQRYAGIELDSDGNPAAHLILLAERPASELNQKDAQAWAASVGGTLPTRQEQALLFANCKQHLPPQATWSCEEVENDASYAWFCDFYGGTQIFTHKVALLSVVAVRRLVILSFNSLD